MDGARLYVGNLSPNTTEASLRHAFEADGGPVDRVEMAEAMAGGRRGFAFVDMRQPADGRRTIAAWHGQELDGRTILVADARSMPARGVRATTEFVVDRLGRKHYR